VIKIIIVPIFITGIIFFQLFSPFSSWNSICVFKVIFQKKEKKNIFKLIIPIPPILIKIKIINWPQKLYLLDKSQTENPVLVRELTHVKNVKNICFFQLNSDNWCCTIGSDKKSVLIKRIKKYNKKICSA
jgi:hypothetical protein